MKPRGLGRIFQPRYRDRDGAVRRSAVWWIQYSHRGETHRESSRSTDRADAVRLLRRRMGEIGQGRRIAPSVERTTFEDLAELLLEDYRANGRRSLRRAEQSLAHLRAFFGLELASEVDEARVRAYVHGRQEEGARNATINRELAALKRAFRLGEIAQKVARVPHVAMLRESAPRKGFFEPGHLEQLLSHLPEPVRPVIQVAYVTGWRLKSEILTRRWQHVDLEAGWLRLDPGETKNGDGRMFPLTPELATALTRQRRWETRSGVGRAARSSGCSSGLTAAPCGISGGRG
jgi:integrase